MSRLAAHVPAELVSQMAASQLSPGARLVLLTLIASPTTTELGVAGSGSDQLAVLTGQPVSSARRALAELEERGFVIRDLSTGELFVPAVVDGFDAARRDNEERPLRSWWVESSGLQWDPELLGAPIASPRIRAAVLATLKPVAS